MLEGEKRVDNCKQKVALAKSKEAKLRKEYKKASKLENNEDLHEVEVQLKQATLAKHLAHEESNNFTILFLFFLPNIIAFMIK